MFCACLSYRVPLNKSIRLNSASPNPHLQVISCINYFVYAAIWWHLFWGHVILLQYARTVLLFVPRVPFNIKLRE